jgi:hypothetical protein
VYLLYLGVRSFWQAWLYPEIQFRAADEDEQSEAFARLTAYREYRGRVGTFRRLLEKVGAVPFDAGPGDDVG